MSRIIDIAKAVAFEINNNLASEEETLPFTAQVVIRPEAPLTELNDYLVQVVPADQLETVETRSQSVEETKIWVAVRKRIPAAAQGLENHIEAADAVITWAERIRDYLRNAYLDEYENVTLANIEHENYLPSDVNTKGVITSLITLTYLESI